MTIRYRNHHKHTQRQRPFTFRQLLHSIIFSCSHFSGLLTHFCIFQGASKCLHVHVGDLGNRQVESTDKNHCNDSTYTVNLNMLNFISVRENITGWYRKRSFIRHTASYGPASSSVTSIALSLSYHWYVQSRAAAGVATITGRCAGNDAERRVWSDCNESETERRRMRQRRRRWDRRRSGYRLGDCRWLVGHRWVLLLRLLAWRRHRDAQVLSAASRHLIHL